MVFITKSYQDLFGVRSYINALFKFFLCIINKKRFLCKSHCDSKESTKEMYVQVICLL